VIDAMHEYVDGYFGAKSTRDNLFLVDRLIHAHHYNQKMFPTRPIAVNLIDCRLSDAIKLLDELAYGENPEPALKEERDEWQARVTETEKRWSIRKW